MSGVLVLKASIVMILAFVALALLKHRSAAIRHTVLQAALFVTLLMPVLSLVLPEWHALPQPLVTIEAPAVPVDTERLEPPTPASGSKPAHASVPVSTGADWHQRILTVWLIGVAVFLARFVLRAAAMELAVRRAQPLSESGWLRIAKKAACRLGIRSAVELRRWESARMPAAWGVFRPVILLPGDFSDWSDARCRSVIAHEMAHVARRDVMMLTLANLVCALYWFNPLVWILRNRLIVESEYASDDLALAEGTSASEYADHLLETAANYQQANGPAPVMAARSQLESRIMAILNSDQNRGHLSAPARFTLAAFALAVLTPLSTLTWAGHNGTQEGSSGVHVHLHETSHSSDFAIHLEELGIDRRDIDALLAGLAAADPITRAASAWALGDIEDARVVDPLIRAGYDSDAVVRQWAVRSLSGWPTPQVADLYLDRLKDGDAEVRQWSVRALHKHDDAVRTAPLIFALEDSNAEVREWAVRVLSTADHPTVQPALANRLQAETDDAVNEWIIRSLDADDQQGIDAMISALYSDNAEVRQWAVRGLHGVRDDRAVDALIAMLSDENDEVREWSVRGLGVCGNDRAIAPLEGMQQDRNADVAEWAGRALNGIEC